MKRGLLAYLTPIVALSIAGIAAYYSVFGLSKLFAGASVGVMIMASSLEVGKLLGASLLHSYWNKLRLWLKVYLTVAVIALMTITSAGIYGYLSSAYETTSAKSEIINKELAVVQLKKDRFNEKRSELLDEKNKLIESINELRIAISNPHTVQYIDRQTGTLITTSSGSARRALQKELDKAILNKDTLSVRIEAASDSISKIDIKMLDKELSNEAERELGPLKYLSEVLGLPMNQVINWFMLLIIFVFDPLAIVLVIIVNIMWKKTKEEKLELEKKRYYKARNKKIEKEVQKKQNKIKPLSKEEVSRLRAKDEDNFKKQKEKKQKESELKLAKKLNLLAGKMAKLSINTMEKYPDYFEKLESEFKKKLEETKDKKPIEKQETEVKPESNEYIKKEEVIIREKPISKKNRANKRPIKNKTPNRGRPFKGRSGLDKKHNR